MFGSSDGKLCLDLGLDLGLDLDYLTATARQANLVDFNRGDRRLHLS